MNEIKEKNVVKGFKVFNPEWTCRGKQYTCPGKFEENVDPKCCNSGMHFCQNAADCFDYYDFDSNNHVAEVIAYGDVNTEGNKSCTDKLEIVREIAWDEVLRIVNTGNNCMGLRNTGNCNTGNCNTGDWNTGNCNTGNCNTGDWNTGDCNTGNCNTGNWNKSSFNTGCFMTEEQKIMFFNKPSDCTYIDWLNSYARRLLNSIPKKVVEWICEYDMTAEEKSQHPEYATTGGYIKFFDESECAQIWWDSLSISDKDVIKALPNFDAAIFEEITGINVV